MYYRGGYMDGGDSREMGLKRQRILDQTSSYYSVPLGSSYTYNPVMPPSAIEYPYAGQRPPPPPPLPVVRLRGLPFDCTESDIEDFMHGLDVVDVLLVHKGKRFTGEAYCVLGYPLQVDFALSRNKKNIGRRYVEVFRSSKQEYYRAIASELSDASSESIPRGRSVDDLADHTGVLRMRGLPFSASKEDIIDFFKKFPLQQNSVFILANSEGRPTGEAFVEFANAQDSRAAMAKDRMTIGSRYIELFPSSREELDEAVARGRVLQKPSEVKDQTVMTAVLRMRGLPYSAEKDDIISFFEGFVLSEGSVHITHNFEGRPTGEAFVEFANTEDAKAALSKDRMTLGSRYIELFPSSPEELNESLIKKR